MNRISQVGFAVMALAAALSLTGCDNIPPIVFTTCEASLQGPLGKATSENFNTAYDACRQNFVVQRQINLCSDAGSTTLDDARRATMAKTKDSCANEVAEKCTKDKTCKAAMQAVKDKKYNPQQLEIVISLVTNYVTNNIKTFEDSMRDALNAKIKSLVSSDYDDKYRSREIPSTIESVCRNSIYDKLGDYNMDILRATTAAVTARCNDGGATYSNAINNDIEGEGMYGTQSVETTEWDCQQRCTHNRQCEVYQYSSTGYWPHQGGHNCFLYDNTNFKSPPSRINVESFRMYQVLSRSDVGRCINHGVSRIEAYKEQEQRAFNKKCAAAAFDSMCPKHSKCAIETQYAPLENTRAEVDSFLSSHFYGWAVGGTSTGTSLKADLVAKANNVDNNWRLFNMFTLPDSQSGTLLTFVSLVAVVAAIGSIATAVRFARKRSTRTATPVASQQELELLNDDLEE